LIRVASLYTGVGGLDFGFILNDAFSHVFANEWSKDAASTFSFNYERLKGRSADFLKIGDIAEFLPTIPEHDLLLGGFPCPSWSLAGKRQGFDDKRGQEFFNCLKVVTDCKPKMFVFENVKGLLSHNNGESLAFMLEKLSNEGYVVNATLHNFANYGIPQKRERVFMVGIRNDIKPFVVEFDKKPAPIVSEVMDYVKANCTFGVLNHNLHIGNGKAKYHWFKILRPGENLKDLREAEVLRRETELGLPPRRPLPKTLMGYVRMDPTTVAKTMAFGNTCLPMHPFEDRSISVREAATIQSFPLDFEFKGGIAAQYKQVGNAVPYKMGLKLADIIATNLEIPMEFTKHG
jgi:DNA (cytosine-5)-methyltransferase 1